MVEHSVTNQEIQFEKEFQSTTTKDRPQQESKGYIAPERSRDESFSEKDIPNIIEEMRQVFISQSVPTKSYEWRMEQLQQLREMLLERGKEFSVALEKDLGSGLLHKTVEYEGPLQEIETIMSNLKDWMEPTDRKVPLILNKPGWAQTRPEPYGLCLIITPWNYPITLLIKPLAGAIAAGNCVVVRSSSETENVSKVFEEYIPKYLDQRCIRIINGGHDVADTLLEQKWDYIFYTGSTTVGKKIMKAAAENLTPLTLELGGKCPAYVDKDCDLEVAASRIVFGKFALNAGQTCVAPDYVLLEGSVYHDFNSLLVDKIQQFFGEDPRKSPDYSKIISKRQMEKLKSYLEGMENNIMYGGQKIDIENRYFEPTLVWKPDENSALMQEKIFGPNLPIIPVENVQEAIDFIKKRHRPLALYVFTNDTSVYEKIIAETSSGAVSINETVMHVDIPTLPFGGVGSSGFGSYGGKSTFETFSHEKPIYSHSTMLDPEFRYPPYSKFDESLMRAAFQPFGISAFKKLFK
jgi:aldehyde dehydrogenase (NAD+)